MRGTALHALAFLTTRVAAAPAVQPAAPPDPAAAVGQVVLTDADGKGFGSATAFWIAPDAAVTNWHVLHEARSAVVIRMPGGLEHRVTRVIGADERADAAVVRAEPPFVGVPLVLNAALPLPGEPVRILAPRSAFAQPLIHGVVLRADEIEFFGPSIFIHTPRAGSYGWSGAPILDEDGLVVGVMRAVGPASGYGAPSRVVEPLRTDAGGGVAFDAWDREPKTRFGRSVARAQRAMRLGGDQQEERVRLLREAVEESPDFWTGWAALGSAAGRQRMDDALDAFERAAALSPEARHGLALADLYRGLGRADEAEAARARAMRTDPVGFLFTTARRRAIADAREGRWSDALGALERAVDGQPDDPELRVALAQGLAFAKRPDEALRHVAEALRVDPGYMPALYARGATLLATARFGEAIEPLRRAVALDPRSVPARALLAHACAHTGDYAGADAQLAALEEIDKAAARRTGAEVAAIRAGRTR